MKYFIVYLILINLITFCVFAYDKKQAKCGGWRIKEKTLLLLCAAGGSFGGLTAMYTCRHKTKKPKFYLGVPVLLFCNILMIVCYLLLTGVLTVSFYSSPYFAL